MTGPSLHTRTNDYASSCQKSLTEHALTNNASLIFSGHLNAEDICETCQQRNLNCSSKMKLQVGNDTHNLPAQRKCMTSSTNLKQLIAN